MSRRTKLIILGIFAILVLVPVGYLAFTLSVRDPLRFRLVGKSGPVPASMPPGYTAPPDLKEMIYKIEVRNTTAAPIEIYNIAFASKDLPALPEGLFVLQDGPERTPDGHPGYHGMIIKPHATAGFICRMGGPHAEALTSLQPHLEYSWNPRTRIWVHEFGEWLKRYTPDHWHGHFQPLDISRSSTPLDFTPEQQPAR